MKVENKKDINKALCFCEYCIKPLYKGDEVIETCFLNGNYCSIECLLANYGFKQITLGE